jgi:CheY-like chemotaxis protein
MKRPKVVVEVPKPALPLEGRRILVVDDEADIRTFLVTVLEDAGAATFQAADGNEAIALAREHKPDLITLDLSMEGKDGIEAFAEIRSDRELREIPVCVVTGHPEFREVIYQRAVPPPDGYMDKPVKEAALVDGIRRILDLKQAKTSKAPTTAS